MARLLNYLQQRRTASQRRALGPGLGLVLVVVLGKQPTALSLGLALNQSSEGLTTALCCVHLLLGES